MQDRIKISELIMGGIHILIGLSAKTQNTYKTTLFIRQRYPDGYEFQNLVENIFYSTRRATGQTDLFVNSPSTVKELNKRFLVVLLGINTGMILHHS